MIRHTRPALRAMVAAGMVAGLALSPAPAHAVCRWVWDCTEGACRHIPQCDNSYDTVPNEPLEVTPNAPLSTDNPLPPNILPFKTTQCVSRRICSQSGQCSWYTKC
ncbi:hypothetical protein [Komagataeibacter swingsii]|uniref:Dickkopf N-terminal cysteine-rich domain-containing protein n=1 Tax=Komagataeibacter swingsii TaxID=215220 RepID=A0A2V4RBI9_9PROT|nr:hypothetical protein [Komagataeibacter swingsii]PYD69490.1 hypothetical protein CFR76_09160 [Komagataeibacter swingsii]